MPVKTRDSPSGQQGMSDIEEENTKSVQIRKRSRSASQQDMSASEEEGIKPIQGRSSSEEDMSGTEDDEIKPVRSSKRRRLSKRQDGQPRNKTLGPAKGQEDDVSEEEAILPKNRGRSGTDDSPGDAENAPASRKRGRSAKKQNVLPVGDETPASETNRPKKRGRPAKKQQVAQAMEAAPASETNQPRKRGRPAKKQNGLLVRDETPASETNRPKKRGRPAKKQQVAQVMEDAPSPKPVQAKKRGRPSKLKTALGGKTGRTASGRNVVSGAKNDPVIQTKQTARGRGVGHRKKTFNKATSSGDGEYEVERVKSKRVKGTMKQYLVGWKGFAAKHDSWEPEQNLSNCRGAIRDYERDCKGSHKK
ncbi:Testis-specific chromodomain protein Y 1 [Colletotrichum sidae]|uniref:Testis-specific chromodomain protein Y 1 n=1 Tax=Colletotrichum sidae TaxID=1347389 RepID=A0A4R8T8D9_9PEZI|nr:Testis-specific chromodomain protein Y 1 [Colletotrichum sidae]